MDLEEVAKFMRTRMATERAKMAADRECHPLARAGRAGMLMAFDVEAAFITGVCDGRDEGSGGGIVLGGVPDEEG